MGKVLKISREIAEVQKLFVILAVILQQLGSSNTNSNDTNHGLRTPNEGINQRYLKNWADVADKICFGLT